MYNPFLSIIIEDTCANGDSIVSPSNQVNLSKNFIVNGQPEKTHFERTGSFLKGFSYDIVNSSIIEEGIEGFNRK